MSRPAPKDIDSKIAEAVKELKDMENHIMEMESRFLATYSKSTGTGENYLKSSAKQSFNNINRKNGRSIKVQDRVFSLSSTSWPYNEKDDLEPTKLPLKRMSSETKGYRSGGKKKAKTPGNAGGDDSDYN
jgi:hypothetical protein